MPKEYCPIPVHLMLEQPQGWFNASLPKIVEISKKSPEQRWLELTGVPASDTHFTIIVPVHNEERCLPSFIGSLIASDLPPQADIQIAFIVNTSSDNSHKIILDHLRSSGPTKQITLIGSTTDRQLSDTVYELQRENIRMLILNTKTAGKANALTIGNELALEKNHQIAINIDANNWPEPDALGTLFRRAHKVLIGYPESKTVLVDGQVKAETRAHEKGTFDFLLDHLRSYVNELPNQHEVGINGCMFAWNPKWISDSGGFPSVVLEDFSIALEAHLQGKNIVHSDAPIWGYHEATFLDRQKLYKRYLLGALQILQNHPNNDTVKKIMQNELPMLLPLRERLRYFFIDRNPVSLPLSATKWLLGELRLREAKSILSKDPQRQTWAPILSTK